MEIFVLDYTSSFLKSFRKLPKHIQNLSFQREQIFRKDCFDPCLRTHKLKGEFSGFWSFSVNYSYRILFQFLSDGSVVFYNIGTHSIYR